MDRVRSDDPALVDRTGQHRIATTDPSTRCIYLTDSLEGTLLETVLIHEIGHALLVSYNLLNMIHMAVLPDKWIDAEEWLCNFISTYGKEVLEIASNLLGYEVRK